MSRGVRVQQFLTRTTDKIIQNDRNRRINSENLLIEIECINPSGNCFYEAIIRAFGKVKSANGVVF
jgi:hypothetical protein